MDSSRTILPTTPPAIVPLDLATVVQRIADEHEACCQAAQQSLAHAMRCGELLLQAKAECGHGKWQPWLRENFPGSTRTAQVYMRLAKNREMIELKTQASAPLTIDEAISVISQPVVDYDELFEQALDFPAGELVGDDRDTLALVRGDMAMKAASGWYSGFASPRIEMELPLPERILLIEQLEAVQRALAVWQLRLGAALGLVLARAEGE